MNSSLYLPGQEAGLRTSLQEKLVWWAIHNYMYVEVTEVDLIRWICQGGFLGGEDI